MIKFKDFILNEGDLSKDDITKGNSKYVKALFTMIANKTPIKFSDGKSRVVEYTDELKEILDVVSKVGGDASLKLKNGSKYIPIFKTPDGNFPWSKIEKTQLSGADSGKKFNRGDVAEGVLAATVTAKFINPGKEIEPSDAYKILDTLSVSRTQNTFIHKSALSGEDQITLKITLKPESLEALLDPENRNDLKEEFAAACEYANSQYVKKHAELLDKNNTNDTVVITSDGAVDEKLTKVDMSVMIGIDDGTPVLTDLNLSVKSGKTKNLEQSGVAAKTIIEIFRKFGLDISHFRDTFVKKQEWYEGVFAYAATWFNKSLLNGDDEKEYELLKNISSGIDYAATKHDSSVLQVHMDGGTFKVLSFKDLEEKLKKLKIEALFKMSAGRPATATKPAIPPRPYLYFLDKVTKEELLIFRLEVRSGEKVNKLHIEKGPLLVKLTKISH